MAHQTSHIPDWAEDSSPSFQAPFLLLFVSYFYIHLFIKVRNLSRTYILPLLITFSSNRPANPNQVIVRALYSWGYRSTPSHCPSFPGSLCKPPFYSPHSYSGPIPTDLCNRETQSKYKNSIMLSPNVALLCASYLKRNSRDKFHLSLCFKSHHGTLPFGPKA